MDVPEFNFTYNDTDTIQAEIAGELFELKSFFSYSSYCVLLELYTYSEEPEFVWNAEAFNAFSQAKCKINDAGWRWNSHRFLLVGETKNWKDLSRDVKLDFIVYLLEQCELVDRTKRSQAMRAILYLAQGKSYWFHWTLIWSKNFQAFFINVRTLTNARTWRKKMFFYCTIAIQFIFSSIFSTWNWISMYKVIRVFQKEMIEIRFSLCQENNVRASGKNLGDNQEMR